MNLLAIDPGPFESAYVVYDTLSDSRPIRDKGIVGNCAMIGLIGEMKPNYAGYADHMAVEMIANMGMSAVGDSIFETCVWIGRFIQEWNDEYTLVKRMEVKMQICGSGRAKDKNIRMALINRFGEPGTKKNPGKLYGIKTHLWAALAVAVTWTETREFEARLK